MSVPANSSFGFGSITTAAAAGTFVQLPDIPCSFVGFGKSNVDLRLATSQNPGSAYIVLTTGTAGSATSTGNVSIPTAGNAKNLWISNDSGSSAQTVGFMWLLAGATYVCPAF